MTGTLLTILEVAERLGLSSAAVTQAVRTGALQPTARTNDDFLFTERAVAAFAERMAEAAASPLQPPASVTRAEWSGDVDRLNLWLKELTEALPHSDAGPSSPAEVALVPAVQAPATDFRPPVPSATPPPAALPEPAATGLEPELPAAAPVAARSLLERIAASQPLAGAGATPSPAEQASAAPEPEPVLQVPGPELEPVTTVTEPEPIPAREPVAAAPAPVLEGAAPPAGPGSELSRQAVLVVQPIVRFRVLRDVTDRLATIPGVAGARLESLEGGVASYRVSFEGERPTGEAIGEALAALNLEVILVESFL